MTKYENPIELRTTKTIRDSVDAPIKKSKKISTVSIFINLNLSLES